MPTTVLRQSCALVVAPRIRPMSRHVASGLLEVCARTAFRMCSNTPAHDLQTRKQVRINESVGGRFHMLRVMRQKAINIAAVMRAALRPGDST